MFIRKYGRQQLAKSWFALVCGSLRDLAIGRAVACDGINSDKGPLGLGRPSFGLK